MKTWSMGSRCYGVGEQEWFFIVDESGRLVARVHPAATETDEETGEVCTGVADYAAIPDVRLMLAAPMMRDTLDRIASACGLPDPANACRVILALCREAGAA